MQMSWTSACRQLDGGNSMIFTEGENAVKSRLAVSVALPK